MLFTAIPTQCWHGYYLNKEQSELQTQQDINTQLYAEATPPDTTYSRLNRDDKRAEEIATYDYADPNQIRVEYSQATDPPPVSGEGTMREEEFYIAEDHTYAAVNREEKEAKNCRIWRGGSPASFCQNPGCKCRMEWRNTVNS